jgi:hypothetical protein
VIGKAEFAKILATLAALFPRFKLTPETITAYYAVLGDLDADLLKAATLHLAAQDSPWFPAAGQLRGAAFSLVEHQEGGVTAGEAWQEARRILRDPVRFYPGISAPAEGDFSDPAIFATVQAIGALDIAHTPEDMVHTTRARFMDTFETIKRRQRTARTMLPAVRRVMAEIAPPRAPELPPPAEEMPQETAVEIGRLLGQWSGTVAKPPETQTVSHEELMRVKQELRDWRGGGCDD